MIGRIVGWSLKSRGVVLVLAAALLVLGATRLRELPVDVLPEFSPPTVEIQTEALGLSATEVEQLITVPLEQDLLNGVAWLDTIRSESIPGLSRVELIFEPGTDLLRARQVVQERLTGRPRTAPEPRQPAGRAGGELRPGAGARRHRHRQHHPAGGRPLLGVPELARAARTTIMVDRPPFPDSDDPLRLLATPVQTGGGQVVVVVGTSTEERVEALETLLRQLLLGGPLMLAVASLLGYGLAAAALRPVESMRREAEAVSAAEPGRRLPLPPGDDEIVRLGTTLNTMLDRLEAALARERRFVSDASHELRIPLASLRTELELALRRPRPPAELEAALRSAAEETERLSRLAEDLLVLARGDGGGLPVHRERLPAAQLLAQVKARYAAQAARAGGAMEVEADGHLEVVADRLRAEQALGNLVENALRHGRGPIRLLARQADGRVELHVQDQGPGFPPEFLDRAFDRFTRADPSRQGPGAGLGLAIVEIIARAHGGTAHAANLHQGADVWIELPHEG